MKQEPEVFEKFKEWLPMVQNRSGKTLKKIRSDRGGEYFSHEFSKYFEQNGIIRDATISDNPWQNGVSERLNLTLLNLVRSKMPYKNVDKDFWAEALSTVVYTRNGVTTKPLPATTTPFELWTSKKANVSNLRVFGSHCWY